MNSTGPPGAGNPHARWDEGAPEEIDQAEILRHCQSKEAAPATAQLPPVSSGLYSTSSEDGQCYQQCSGEGTTCDLSCPGGDCTLTC